MTASSLLAQLLETSEYLRSLSFLTRDEHPLVAAQLLKAGASTADAIHALATERMEAT